MLHFFELINTEFFINQDKFIFEVISKWSKLHKIWELILISILEKQDTY